MKTYIFYLGFFFFSVTASASPTKPVVLGTCQSQAQSQYLRFSQYLSSDIGLIEFYDANSGRYERLPAQVAYTNGGARAIFSYGGNTPLILVGTGQSSIVFRSQIFNCRTNF